ncbi:DNA (cytosine-5-)-methyltransferase [Thiothrix fructosivorans]|uniref:Cytosine-specific methyltransferase n=1 Tax=Thiothrix fructosivorans TaxID=111770 RepID=A0A8B0SLZ6_9GAMM|nr:DNA (cytosine-5-)-methyltransferase [Thiothrix fructosivorans]MBO0612157.1 DNA (cytosine-5-)-methyltransferase [Thiothrix fructosivorans]QTX12346.1 DNA (cytosine-5-)-methyltransferase [Thiothrix fructosivorans]
MVSLYLEKAENALLPLAKQYTPDGSSPHAVVNQWLHAFAYGFNFFGLGDTGIEKVSHQLLLNHVNPDVAILKSEIGNISAIKTASDVKFTFIDLFAGIGGMRVGAQQVGGACVFSSEFDRFAQQTYKMNHGELPFGDITKIEPLSIPEHDLLIAGFPCQPFSHAGLKLGIDDTRGTLFHNIANILKVKQPRVALLENVRGLVSHDGGYTLQVILKVLTKMGYSCNIPSKTILYGTPKDIQIEAKKMILKSVDYGIPQNRQRIYIVLWKTGLCDSFVYPEKMNMPTRVGDMLESNPLPKYTISNCLWEGHQRRKKMNKINGKGFGYSLVSRDSSYTSTISARYYKDGSEILIAQPNKNPRKVTPREAARLQGFPDSFMVSPSDSQAYKQFGNSVTVPVVQRVVEEIAKQILRL